MNLKVIFEKQIKLDETLHNNVINPNEKNLREKEIIALLVELGEFANEVKLFKYWKKHKEINQTKMLEEFADGIHFLTSLAAEFHVDYEINVIKKSSDFCLQLAYVYKIFIKLFRHCTKKLVVCKIGGLIEFSTKASQKRACFLFLALRDIWCFGNTIFSKNNKFKIFYILFSQSETFKSSLNEMIKIWKKSP